MLCRVIVTCALVGHVVLTLPAARAPRYTPLPDEVDSDETRRVLGSSVVTSVSVIMDLGNGSQALFSESSNNHHIDHKDSVGKPEASITNPLSPEKRPVGSPPALMSPDRYEFYTFDESGELVRRLMTLEQIQSLIAGGDDANRIAALPLDIEIDTVPSPQATDPQGQVVANVQQVLAEELLASTKKNGTEPQETEVEVEAEVQEVPPPPSSPRPAIEDEPTVVEVSTENVPEVHKPTVSATTTGVPMLTVTEKVESSQEQEKVDETFSSSTENIPQEETAIKDSTSMRPVEIEPSSTLGTFLEEEIVQETVDEVKEPAAESVTPLPDKVDALGEVEASTKKQDEHQETVPLMSKPAEDGMPDVKDSVPAGSSTEGEMDGSDDHIPEEPVKTEMESEKEDKPAGIDVTLDTEKGEVTHIVAPESPIEPEDDDFGDTQHVDEPSQLTTDGEVMPTISDFINKNPPKIPVDEQPLLTAKPQDSETVTPTTEMQSDIRPSESTSHTEVESTMSNVEPTSFNIETFSDNKDVVDDAISTGVFSADVDEIPSSVIPTASQIPEEADLSELSDEILAPQPTFDDSPDEEDPTLADIGVNIQENPAAPDLEAVLPENPAISEEDNESESKPALIPAMPTPGEDKEEIIPEAPEQVPGAEEADSGDKVEEEDEDDDLLDQLAESVSSVLSQVSDIVDVSDDDEFKRKPELTPVATTQQPEDDIPVTTHKGSIYQTTVIDNVKHDAQDTSSPQTDLAENIPIKEQLPVMHSELEEGKPNTPVVDDLVKEENDEKEDGTNTSEDGKDDTEKDNTEEKEPDESSKDSEKEIISETSSTESIIEIHDSTEGSIPTVTPYEILANTEESDKESESVNGGDKQSDSAEKESESTENAPISVEKISIPNIADLENVQVAVVEDTEEKTSELPTYFSTDSPDMANPTLETDMIKDTSIEESETTEEPKITEASVINKEKLEVTTAKSSYSGENLETMTIKTTSTEDDAEKGEDVKDDKVHGNDEDNEEEQQKISQEMTTEDAVTAITEDMGIPEKEVEQDIDLPTNVSGQAIIPEPDGEEKSQAVKDVAEDLALIEEMHKEAEKDSDPLLQSEKHEIDLSIDASKNENPMGAEVIQSVPTDKPEEEVNAKDGLTTLSSMNLETVTNEQADENKPTEISVNQDMEDKETTLTEEDSKVEPTKPSVVAADIEQPVDSSSVEPSKNPWTSIPIPIHPQVSTTPESSKQPTSLPPITLSTSKPDKLPFPSAAPDDFPDPNGLLPLLTEKPAYHSSPKPSDDLISTTGGPISTHVSSTAAPSTTTATAGGAVVPPLMPAFPQAPQNNAGLEATSASTDPDVKRFVDLCNDLAFALYGQVTSGSVASSVPAVRGANGGGVQTRSLVVSPYAIVSLLAMMFLGARGPTSEEMNDLLRLDDMITFNPHLVLQNVTDAVITSPGVSAAAFVRELYSDKTNGKLLDFYKARAKAFYDGHVEEVDFKEVNDVLRRRTNHLVRWQTRGRVPEYLRGSSLKLRPPLAALSANFFEADCQRASSTGTDGEMYFEVPATGRRRRRLVPVPAVVWRGVFLAGHDAGLDATVLELRHGGGEVSTVLVLPGRHGQSLDAGDISGGLTRLENWLISGGKDSWSSLLRSALPRGPLEVQLPRFAHRSVLNVTGALSRMGLQHLFQEGKADLGGLDGGLGGKLHLADMIQMTAFGVCADDGSSKRHLETYPSAQRTGRKHTRSIPDDLPEESPEEYVREGRSGWTDELAREEDDSYVFAAAAAARELPLALRPRQARIPRPALKQQQSRIVLPRLRFDRPFLYFVRHNPSGFILLMGRFNPRLFP